MSCVPVVMAPDPLGLQTVAGGWLATSEGGGVPVEYVNTCNNTFYIQTVQLAPNVTAHQIIGIPFQYITYRGWQSCPSQQVVKVSAQTVFL